MEPRLFDVVALGELVIDLVPVPGPEGQPRFSPKPGGAPGNVAVGVARLGGRAAMLSKVGEDAFGRRLIETLVENGVVTEGVRTTRDAPTSLAVVTVEPDGERDFLIYRKGSADSTYAPDEVLAELICDARFLHMGSLWLGDPVCAAAQRFAVRVAREAGVLVSVDVNLRPMLWRNSEEMRATALAAAGEADVLKVSEDELRLIAGTSDLAEALASLRAPARRLTAVTFGAGGALLAAGKRQARVAGFPVRIVDTVGCGDAFVASLLMDLANRPHDLDSKEGLVRLGRRACAAGALAATSAGAMGALPTAAELDTFLLAAPSV